MQCTSIAPRIPMRPRLVIINGYMHNSPFSRADFDVVEARCPYFGRQVRQPIAPALGDRGEAVSAARMRRELIPTIFRVEFLEAEINAKGMTVFARIDHAAGAAEVGLPLRPTELLIAKAGTPAHARQPGDWHRSAPLKALVHEDATGKVWLTCNDPHWLAKRHGVAVAQTVDAMAATLNAVATKATKSP
jgi:uncharacterized protein (DUF302 family)